MLSYTKLYYNYSSATSSATIRVKPAANRMVTALECSPSAISGTSSSTKTYIIAPAAKLRRYSRTGVTNPAASTLSPLNGIHHAECHPIPERVGLALAFGPQRHRNDCAFGEVLDSKDQGRGGNAHHAAYPTSVHHANGYVLRDIMQGNSQYQHGGAFQVDVGPSAVLSRCIWGTARSSTSRNRMPSQNPTAAGTNDHCPSWADCSSAGMSKLYTVATTITPAAKLIRAFCRLMFMVSRTKNKQAAPRLVPAKGMSSPVKTVASVSCN